MDRLYHESYEHPPSSPSSRRNESFSTLSPKDASSKAGQSYYSNRRANDRYDPRYHYPPTTSHIAKRPSRSPLRKRASYPPQPCAEDEAQSLCKEAGWQKLLRDIGKDEVPSRGTIDQDPVISDVIEYHLHNQHDRRFTYSGADRGSTAVLTPPTSEDEKARKARRRPSKLNINNDQFVPEASQRTASPYSFSRASNSRRDDLSNDRLVPPLSSTSTTSRDKGGSKPSSPRRDSGRISPGSRRGNNYFTAGDPTNEAAIDDDDYDRKLPDKRSLAGNGKRLTELPNCESLRNSPSDVGAPPPANAPSIRRQNLDARRNTDTQNNLPTLGRLSIDKSRRPTPLVASTSLSEAHEDIPAHLDPKSAEWEGYYPRSREQSYFHARPVSREGSVVGSVTPASRSPRASTELVLEGSIKGSRPPSMTTASRPASPSPVTPAGESPRIPRTDLDWSALLANNAARRNKPSSRLASGATPQSPAPESTSRRVTPQEMKPGQASHSLPYPEDDSLMGSILMPDDREHAFNPAKKALSPQSFSRENSDSVRNSSPSPSASTSESVKPPLPARPTLNRGYSAATALPIAAGETRPRTLESRRTTSFASSSQAKKEIATLVKKGLPPCPRQTPVAGKSDWYTIIGHTNIDFCPDCIETLFERTVFRSSFRRSLPRNYDDKVRCAFGSPWIRLAWLLTLQQQRTDLTLLQDIADIEETSTACPGAVETVTGWYGLRDPDGLFVRDFHLCYGDVRKIECLLPSLSGIFVRLPQRASYTKSTCAIRTDSTRFSVYLDALVNSHEKALQARQNADPLPLIELVERKTRLRECTRDNVLIGGLWHFIPDLAPAMTVCEDCFEAVVEPEIKKNKSVARKFNRTVQPVYSEGMGCSCQLYSPYMRKAFQRAVDDNDMKYLVRKAKERREAEIYLQDKFKLVMAKAARLSQEGNMDAENERRLNRDLEKISSEWKEQWE